MQASRDSASCQRKCQLQESEEGFAPYVGCSLLSRRASSCCLRERVGDQSLGERPVAGERLRNSRQGLHRQLHAPSGFLMILMAHCCPVARCVPSLTLAKWPVPSSPPTCHPPITSLEATSGAGMPLSGRGSLSPQNWITYAENWAVIDLPTVLNAVALKIKLRSENQNAESSHRTTRATLSQSKP